MSRYRLPCVTRTNACDACSIQIIGLAKLPALPYLTVEGTTIDLPAISARPTGICTEQPNVAARSRPSGMGFRLTSHFGEAEAPGKEPESND